MRGRAQPLVEVFGVVGQDEVVAVGVREQRGDEALVRRLHPAEGSYLRPVDCCITQLKAQRPSRTCKERKEEEESWTTRPRTTFLHAATYHCFAVAL